MKPFLTWLNQPRRSVSRRLAVPIALGLLLQGTTLATQSAIAQTITINTVKPPLSNQAQFSYSITSGGTELSGSSNALNLAVNNGLTDPGGQILGCGGQPLSDYTGFSVGLYQTNPTDPTGSELGPLLSLTTTEVPDDPKNAIPLGVQPNTTNINPYPLSTEKGGRFSFLLDRSRGQIAVGATSILVVNPPAASKQYNQRRIRLKVLGIVQQDGNDVVTYSATSLDGLPITASGATQFNQNVVLIENSSQVGLQLLALRLDSTLCQQNQVKLTKSADRASAAPGDTVIYRLSIRNTSDGALKNVSVSDQLPFGFQFLPQAVRGELSNQTIPIQVTQAGQTVTLSAATMLPVGSTLNIVYAAKLSTDAIRGTGKNYANVVSHRADNNAEVKDGPAIQQVILSAGLMTNCGTIIGRVFEDHNFDGEQQNGEPGIPNAVVYLEDGNRVTTDAKGLFSVKCALPGYHTGVLDPMSVPGYQMAPNHRFIERNSPSRLVRLEPNGMARMNFAVVPVGKPEEKP